jgi:Fe2+ transport system protein FeoA
MDRALRRRGRRRHARRRSHYEGYGSLEQVTPGWSAVVSNLTRLPPGKRRRLEALGLTVGEAVEVIAQSPVTVIRAGHAQLALSAEISRLIEVETEDGR